MTQPGIEPSLSAVVARAQPTASLIPGLHNSGSSKGQIININLLRAAKVYFISMYRFRCSMEEILERQSLIQCLALATFCTIEKTLAGGMKSFREPFVVQA